MKLWDARSGRRLRTLYGHTSGVNSVAFSPDGATLVSGGVDGTLKLWEAGSGRLLRTLEGHSVAVTSVAFSPDGTMVVSGSADNTLKLWDASNGDCLDTFTGDAPFRCVAVTHDAVCAGDEAGRLHRFDLRAGPGIKLRRGPLVSGFARTAR